MLLSKKLVCAMLSVSPATLARWEADPKLSFPKRTRIGGGKGWAKAFWRKDDVEAWIDSHTKRSTGS